MIEPPNNIPDPIERNLEDSHRASLVITSGIDDTILKKSGIFSADPALAGNLTGIFQSGVIFEYVTLQGDVLGHRLRLDEPLTSNDGQTMKYCQKKGSALHAYFLADDRHALLEPTIPIVVVEGEKKLLSLAGTIKAGTLAPLATPGCWNYAKKTSDNRKELAGAWSEIPFNDRDVFLIPDTDVFTNNNVFSAYCTMIRLLTEKGARVALVDLRIEGTEDKIGVDDFILKKGADEFFERARNPIWCFSTHDQEIQGIGANDDEVTDFLKKRVLLPELELETVLQSLKKITKLPLPTIRRVAKNMKREWENFAPPPEEPTRDQIKWWYEMDPIPNLFGWIGTIISAWESWYQDPDAGYPIILKEPPTDYIRILTGQELSEFLADKIRFQQGRADHLGAFKADHGFEPIPAKLLNTFILAVDKYASLRKLRIFSSTPLFLDGRLISEPGYNPDTESFYAGLPVPPKNTFERVEFLLDSFPFVDGASCINALGAILSSVFFRQELLGQRPMDLVCGNEPNLGKTTLLQCIHFIAFKRVPTTISFNPNDEEFEKSLAKEIRARDHFLIDNVKSRGTIQSSTLERMLTDPILNFRLLGASQSISRPNNVSLGMTVNDGQLCQDLITRSNPIFLSSDNAGKMQRNFNPLDYVQIHRDEILSELCGMVQKWLQAGSPDAAVFFPKYPRYARVIGGILEANGFKGFLNNYGDAMSKLDPVSNTLLELAAQEISVSTERRTPERSAGDWRGRLEAIRSTQLFEPNASLAGKNVVVGKTFAKLSGKVFPVLCESGEKLRVTAHSRVNPSKNGASSFHWFTLDDKAPVETPSVPTDGTVVRDENVDEAKKNISPTAVGNVGENAPTGQATPGKPTEPPSILCVPGPGESGVLWGTKVRDPGCEIIPTHDRTVEPTLSVPGFPHEPTVPSEAILLSVGLVTITPEFNEVTWVRQSAEKQFSYQWGENVYPGTLWKGECLPGKYLSTDFETTLIVPGKVPRYVVGAAFNGERLVFIQRDQLAAFFHLHSDQHLVAHNAAFELAVAAKTTGDDNLPFCLLDNNHVTDTFLLARLINLATEGNSENIKGKYTLGSLVQGYLGVSLPKEAMITGKQVRLNYAEYEGRITEAPDGYLHYLAFDAISTFFLEQKLRKIAGEIAAKHQTSSDLLLSLPLQIKASYAATLTEKRSFMVEQKTVKEHQQLLEGLLRENNEQLKSKYGYFPGAGRDLRFNQAAEMVERKHGICLPKKTNAKGKVAYSLKKDDLEPFAATSDFVAAFIAHESLQKLLSTYVVPFLDQTECHPRINILKTTGRISMEKPPLQTIPKPTDLIDLRKQFIARPGYILVIADFVCAELVSLAQTCLDRLGTSRLADALNRDQDIHRLTASKFFGVAPEALSQEQRAYGKVANFGLPGGMGAAALVKNAKTNYHLDLALEDAKQIRASWLETYPEMTLYLKQSDVSSAKMIDGFPYPSNGNEIQPEIAVRIFLGIMSGNLGTKTTNRIYNPNELDWAWSVAVNLLQSHVGRLSPFAEAIQAKRGSFELERACRSLLTSVITRTGRVRANCGYTEFCNNPFQGLQADITNLAWYELHKQGFPVVNLVHDEFICEVPQGTHQELETYRSEIGLIMVRAAASLCPDVKMRVESKISAYWEK